MAPATAARAEIKRTQNPQTIASALDYLRLDAVSELADVAADLAITVSQAAADGDTIRTTAYLTMLSRSVANALRIAAQLKRAEACE